MSLLATDTTPTTDTSIPRAPSREDRAHEHDDRQVVKVPLDRIDVPPDWRTIDEPEVGEIAASLRELGLLQPIGVWPRGDDRYTLVFGRHRMLAAARLGWDAIDARRLEFATDADRQVATDVENLRRSNLNAADEALALNRWHDWYLDRHPDAARAGGEQLLEVNRARNEGREPAPKAPRFTKHAAATTGKSERAIRRSVTLAKKLGEEALDVLRRCKVSERDLVLLSKVRDPELRGHAVSLTAAGLSPAKAIAEAENPGNLTVEHVDADPDDLRPPLKQEADLGDEEWLSTYCFDALKRIKNPHHYKADAILYRKTREAREDFKNRTKKALAQGKVQVTGPFHYALSRAVNVDHPSAWLPCGACAGSGYNGTIGQCGKCNGHGYHLAYARGSKRT